MAAHPSELSLDPDLSAHIWHGDSESGVTQTK
eukprot:CAMPEP_0114674312 /NCGR_PEP_ID=MMETSP0191-20121206/46112_1 /TAXON_ID=126664 /ORGANISM="Sorites sp." /LENGTH=31 /DNA_ID= /DNA_START= /DNA_END= /DNA_ORIENTATION=